MVFSSQIFLFYFLPISLLLYYVSPRSFRLPVLTGVSLLFYSWLRPAYVLLLLWSTCVDFICGNFIYGRWRLIGPPAMRADGTPLASNFQRRLFLSISLLSNLGVLGFFKYGVLLQRTLNAARTAMGRPAFHVLEVLLPAGISFYTFESISYVLDIYYGRSRPASANIPLRADPEQTDVAPRARGRWAVMRRELQGFNAFACYITQFPHLVAGPIIRYQDLEGQLYHRSHNVDKFARGAFFFALGMAKKVLLANPLGDIADITFLPHQPLRSLDAWYGLAAYSFQIYFDFSGYTDMAIGLGLMLGFEFPRNFDSPYKAQSITDFWRRWHITLSTWLRDYLYIPLGGNRRGEPRTYLNLVTVMLLGGLWHGAAWKFMFWGGIHGSWLVVERLFGKRSFYNSAPRLLRVGITFLIVSLAWVFFRAATLNDASSYLQLMFISSAHGRVSPLLGAALYTRGHVMIVVIAALIAFFGWQTWDLSKQVTPLRAAFALAVFAASVAAQVTQASNPFLYFQF